MISNLESWATGTFHGLSTVRLQSLRGRPLLEVLASRCDADAALVADCCLKYYRRDQLRGKVFRPQSPVPPDRRSPGGGGRTDTLRS